MLANFTTIYIIITFLTTFKNEIPPLPLPSLSELSLREEDEKCPMEEEKDNSTPLDQ